MILVKGKSLASLDPLIDAKSQLPREAVWLLVFEVCRKGAYQVTGLLDGVRADHAENRTGVALYDVDIGESAIGIHVESNHHAIDANLSHCLLDFIIPSGSDCEIELVLVSA